MGNPPAAHDGKSASYGFREVKEDLSLLTKSRLSLLVVSTTLFGYVLAAQSGQAFSWGILIHTFVGTAMAAFAAGVFNQLMEVDQDARMTRTSNRPLPGNRIPRAAAFVLGWLLASFGLIHLGMKVNMWAAGMAAATLFTYLFVYTPMKRVSTCNTIVGAVSGALPPLIGWAAGGQDVWNAGGIWLFGFLFLWQLPHFAAINWMYRDEYRKGGFVMWSNDDEDGRRTARIALFYSVLLVLHGALFPLVATGGARIAGGVLGAAAGAVMVWLSLRFLRSGRREHARALFLYTLAYLLLTMTVYYLTWS